MGSRPNARERRHMVALKALNVARNAMHPGGHTPKDLRSPVAVTKLLEASHNVGFMGPGRSVANPTRVLTRKGNLSASRVDMEGTANFGKPMPAYPDYRPTAPASKRFAMDDYEHDEAKRHPVLVEKRVRVPGKKGTKWDKFRKAGTVTTYDPPYHPGRVKK